MYGLSTIVTLVGALALAGCSDSAKESKGEKGEPGPPGPKGEPGVAGTTLRVVAPQSSTASCQTDEIMISAYCTLHLQRLPVGTADERRALRRQSQFDNSARHDRLCKTIAGKPLSWRAGLPLGAAWDGTWFLPRVGVSHSSQLRPKSLRSISLPKHQPFRAPSLLKLGLRL
jgi:hypothetical protein